MYGMENIGESENRTVSLQIVAHI